MSMEERLFQCANASAMAFRSTRALHFCGQESLEAAVTWLAQHEEDTGLDEPLLIPKVTSSKR